jgi:hypothetical protein
LQIVGLMADNHRLTEKMQSSSELNQRASRNLELKVQSLEHDLELARSELNSVQSEYESYKVVVSWLSVFSMILLVLFLHSHL